jgi:hypothetical protein
MLTPTAAPRNETQALQVRVRELESLLKISEARCAKLEYKLQDLLRRIFDPKNEKLNPAQRALFGLPEAGASPPPAQATAASGAATAASAKRKKGGGRRPPPENLPVRREVIDLPEDQRVGLVKIRERSPLRLSTNRACSSGGRSCGRCMRASSARRPRSWRRYRRRSSRKPVSAPASSRTSLLQIMLIIFPFFARSASMRAAEC